MMQGAGVVPLAMELMLLFARVAVVIGCAWMLTRAMAKGSAAVRHGVWAAGLVAALSLPLLQVVLPPLSVPLPAAYPGAATAGTPNGAGAVVVRDRSSPGSMFDRVASDGSVAAGGSGPVDPAQGSMSLGRLLLIAWLAGVGLRLGWVGIEILQTNRILYRSRTSTRTSAIAASLTGRTRFRRSVRVVTTRVVSMPVTWGLFRPIIALPEESEGWPEDRLRVVILHELAHVRRYDYLTCMVAELACAIYWPVPLVWLARERLRVEQERSCDDRVLAAGTPSLSYAEHLLAVARDAYGRQEKLGMAVAMAREVRLKDRVRAILNEEVDRRSLLAGGGVRGVLVLATIGLPVGAVQFGNAPAGSDPRRADLAVAEETVPVASPPSVGDNQEPIEPATASISAYLWFEAEQGARGGTTKVREDLDASNASFVDVRPSEGDASAESTGHVSLPFRIDSAAEYYVWARLVSDRDESLRLSVGEGSEILWTPRTEKDRGDRDWEWFALRPADSETPVPLALGPGDHVLRLRGVGDPVQIDRVLLTSDPGFEPRGTGPLNESTPPLSLLLEAEDADMGGRFRSPSDRDALGGEYLVFRRASEERGEGLATFRFDVEHAGRYLIWGRIRPQDDDENSFFVSVDGGPELIWDVPSRRGEGGNGNWRWDPLNARDVDGRAVDPLILDLDAGRHTLKLRTRESGTTLDALLITSDLSSRPRHILEDGSAVTLSAPASDPARAG